jgi:hypothetical protein
MVEQGRPMASELAKLMMRILKVTPQKQMWKLPRLSKLAVLLEK